MKRPQLSASNQKQRFASYWFKRGNPRCWEAHHCEKSTVWAVMCSHHGQRCKTSVETRNAPSKCFSLEIQLNYVMWLAYSLRRPGMMTAGRIHHVVSFWHIGLHQFINNYCSWVSIYTTWGNIIMLTQKWYIPYIIYPPVLLCDDVIIIV